MSKRTLVAAVVVALVVGLMAPGAAMAKSAKASTAFRGVKSRLVVPKVHAEGKGAQISGRLVYRKTVVKNGRRRTVDALMAGVVKIYRRSTTNYGWSGVKVVRTANGRFSVDVGTGGTYLVQYAGTKNRRSCYTMVEVNEDALGLDNFKAISGSEVTSGGGIFVTMNADISVPDGRISRANPAALVLVGSSFGAGSSLTAYRRLSTSLITPVNPFGGLFTIFAQTIPSSGSYHVGFTVPAGSRDETLSVIGMLGGPNCVDKDATAEFVPSSLLK